MDSTNVIASNTLTQEEQEDLNNWYDKQQVEYLKKIAEPESIESQELDYYAAMYGSWEAEKDYYSHAHMQCDRYAY
ncbi:MAG TPA: hypothetical protein V6D15_16025 [Oculatellaceae cyanobacterium]|jgi:hypothetical protein